ncbi:MAG: type II toxin-antitoxin system PemK/MazF family toxin [Eubacterium sp.]
MRKLRRGDLVYIDLGQHPHSSVQSGVRPCIVISSDLNNRYSPTVNVCPCTSKLKKIDLPVHTVIVPDQVRGYMEKSSLVLGEQIVTVDKRKIIAKLGYIPADSNVMKQIDMAIRKQLAV